MPPTFIEKCQETIKSDEADIKLGSVIIQEKSFFHVVNEVSRVGIAKVCIKNEFKSYFTFILLRIHNQTNKFHKQKW